MPQPYLYYYTMLILSYSRFPDSRHHKLLLDFLQSVGAHYLAQCRANKFIVDLLHLDVPALFISDNDGSTSTMQSDILSGSIADEFTTFLSGYIQCNNLKRAILDTIESIWVSLYFTYSTSKKKVKQMCRTCTLKTEHNMPRWAPNCVHWTLMAVLQLCLVHYNPNSMQYILQLRHHHKTVVFFLTNAP